MKAHNVKYGTVILTIISSAGVIATGITAAKAAPKAIKLQKELEKEKGTKLTKKEKIKASIPAYILPFSVGLSTILCICGSTILSAKQQASLASAYGLLSSSYAKYQNKVKQMYGEEAHKEIMKSIAIESTKEVNIWSPGITGATNTDFGDDEEVRLFYDAYSDRYFESTNTKVLQAQMHLNRNYVLRGLCASVNEFYDFLGLDPIEGGDQIGWVSEYEIEWIDFNNYKITLEDAPAEASGNRLECNVIEFAWLPDAETFQRNIFL